MNATMSEVRGTVTGRMSTSDPHVKGVGPRDDRDEHVAPEGTVWVCGACGKTAEHRINGGLSRGWDVSCAMNSTLCVEDSLEWSNDKCYVTKAEAVESNDGD